MKTKAVKKDPPAEEKKEAPAPKEPEGPCVKTSGADRPWPPLPQGPLPVSAMNGDLVNKTKDSKKCPKEEKKGDKKGEGKEAAPAPQ